MSRLPRNFALCTALFALALTLPWLAAPAAKSKNVSAPTDAPQSATATPTPEKGKKKSKKGATAESTPAAAATPEAASTPAAKGTPENGSKKAESKGTPATAPAKTPSKATAAGAPSESEIAAAKASGKVWVNLDSGVYHKGGRWYGNTKNGKFMTEAEAQKAGYREAQK
jgi:hypothetical protein